MKIFEGVMFLGDKAVEEQVSEVSLDLAFVCLIELLLSLVVDSSNGRERCEDLVVGTFRYREAGRSRAAEEDSDIGCEDELRSFGCVKSIK